MSKYVFFAIILSSLIIAYYVPPTENKILQKKLYFEIRKKDKPILADGFLKYKGKWCPIVLNDSMAVIYQ